MRLSPSTLFFTSKVQKTSTKQPSPRRNQRARWDRPVPNIFNRPPPHFVCHRQKRNKCVFVIHVPFERRRKNSFSLFFKKGKVKENLENFFTEKTIYIETNVVFSLIAFCGGRKSSRLIISCVVVSVCVAFPWLFLDVLVCSVFVLNFFSFQFLKGTVEWGRARALFHLKTRININRSFFFLKIEKKNFCY